MNQLINKRLEGLKKTIITLEWDLPNIKNSDLRANKEFLLKQYKKELESLMKDQSKAS